MPKHSEDTLTLKVYCFLFIMLIKTLIMLPFPSKNSEPGGLSVWTSALTRTIETAKYVDSNETTRFNEINEINSGKLDGLSYDEFAEQYPDDFASRENDKLCYRYPGGT